MFTKLLPIGLMVLLGQNCFAEFKLTGLADVDHQVVKYIAAEIGGVLETTDSEGNIYRLTIPAKALAVDKNITLTPIKIRGIEGQENHIGVDIAPAGTKLFEFAKLEIVPKNLNSTESYWLETQGDANNMSAQIAFSVSNSKAMLLSHFSGGSLVSGSNVGGAISPGTFDGSAGWYQQARNFAKQNYESGKIDRITYDTQIEIIKNRSKTTIEQEHQAVLDNAKKAADEAIKRAEQQSKDGKIEDFQKILDNTSIMLAEERLKQLSGMGIDSDFRQRYMDIFHNYFKALYANCKNKPIGINATYTAERVRQLMGDEAVYDLNKCYGGLKLIHMTAEYVLNYKTKRNPIPGSDGVNNVHDKLDVLMQISYSSAEPNITILTVDVGDPKTSFENEYDPTPAMGEGCNGTQDPIGNYEVFSYKNKYKVVAAYYNAGTADLPLPPGFPRTDPFGILQLDFSGFQEKRGWHLTADHESCRPKDIPAAITNTNVSFYFDPTKIEKVGQKIVDPHLSDDDYQTSGWVYTYERAE
jgi:hypothetical protein